ncbi:MAG: type I-E CRISPR-associated protein Cas6/Cse3/CasE [Cellulomonadaceae bacterium]|nr:type I-E CRISPR-associated protein Cas6/Cse3/CasE [Cellulomonadaceae bacterium]
MGVHTPDQVSPATSAITYWTAVPAHELAQRDWRDVAATHRAVMALFDEHLPGPAHERRACAGILYRLDDTPHGRFVLVQSRVPPTRPTPSTLTKDATAALRPPRGTSVRFRVAVNAVQRPANGGTRPVPNDDVESWLAAKMEPGLTGVNLLTHTRQVHSRGDRSLQVDTINGIATVTETTVLTTLLRTGVGRAKAYGCGLLTLAPAG